MKRHLGLLLVTLMIVSMTFISLAEPIIVSAKDIGISVKSMALEPTIGVENTEVTDGTLAIEAPVPAENPGPTVTPEPVAGAVPTVTPEPSDGTEHTENPGFADGTEPTETPEPVEGEEPTETSAPGDQETMDTEPFVPKTLQRMAEYDYIGNSVTNVSTKKLSTSALQKQVTKFGTLVRDGMPYQEYIEAMSYQWKDCTDYQSKPTKITVDITKTMDYKTYVDTLKKLSRYDGVYLYIIGSSTEGRDLYAIEIDVDNQRWRDLEGIYQWC